MDIWGEAEAGNVRSVKLYVEQGELLDRPAPSNRRRTPLHCAATGKTTTAAECIKILAAAGAELEVKDMDGMTPLHLCVRKGHYDSVVALLEAGADRKAQAEDGTLPGQFFEEGVGQETRNRIIEAMKTVGGGPRGKHQQERGNAETAAISKSKGGCCCICS